MCGFTESLSPLHVDVVVIGSIGTLGPHVECSKADEAVQCSCRLLQESLPVGQVEDEEGRRGKKRDSKPGPGDFH